MAAEPNYLENLTASNTAPAVDCVMVTPSDSSPLPDGPCRGFYVGGGGNVTITTGYGNTVLFANVAAGTILPVQASQVKATGTTSTNIVALY